MFRKIKYTLILFALIVTSASILFMNSKTPSLQTELSQEVQAMPLSVEGMFPKWLNGVFVRNSSIPVFKEGSQISHHFDGIAMLHNFTFDQGNITYTNRFLLSDAYDSVINKNSSDYGGFASNQSFWKKLRSYFVDSSKWVMNASVNVFKYGNDYVALTEAPGPACFDLHTLETKGTFTFHDDLPKSRCFESAHPHLDFTTKEILNYLIEFGQESKYVLYGMEEGSSARNVIAKIPVEHPAYMHSFAMTKNYLILTEFPFVVRPLDLVITNKSYIHNFKWEPERGTKFLVVERSTGKLISQATTESFFSWHHANAFESENGDLIIDLVAFPDLEMMTGIFPQTSNIASRQPWLTRLMRYHYSLNKHEISSEILLEKVMEFPRIDDRLDGKPYRYLYLTLSNDLDNTFSMNELGKFDLETKQLTIWNAPGHKVLEPVFIPSPESQTEDDGVVLTVIHDVKKNSFLVALDGRTFKEIARAKMPWHIPSSFHGQYFSESTFVEKKSVK